MQAASTECVVDGVEPRGALPVPPTHSGGGRAADSLPDSAPISFPFFFDFFSSSSSPFSAARFVSPSSSRSYLLETVVDLTSPLRPLLRRGFDGAVQSAMPCARASGGRQ